MNCLAGNIASIQTNGQLSLVKVRIADVEIQTVVLESPASLNYLKIGTPVRVMFKETEVILSKLTPESSLVNKFTGIIQSIDKGVILSRIMIEVRAGKITSVITTEALQAMNLKVQDSIFVLINTNEIMLAE